MMESLFPDGVGRKAILFGAIVLAAVNAQEWDHALAAAILASCFTALDKVLAAIIRKR